MSHHIDSKGRFQSDKYPELAPDKIVLSFRDQGAWPALRVLAATHPDIDLAEDVGARMQSIVEEMP